MKLRMPGVRESLLAATLKYAAAHLIVALFAGEPAWPGTTGASTVGRLRAVLAMKLRVPGVRESLLAATVKYAAAHFIVAPLAGEPAWPGTTGASTVGRLRAVLAMRLRMPGVRESLPAATVKYAAAHFIVAPFAGEPAWTGATGASTVGRLRAVLAMKLRMPGVRESLLAATVKCAAAHLIVAPFAGEPAWTGATGASTVGRLRAVLAMRLRMPGVRESLLAATVKCAAAHLIVAPLAGEPAWPGTTGAFPARGILKATQSDSCAKNWRIHDFPRPRLPPKCQ